MEGLEEPQLAELWRRWRAGQSGKRIAAALGCRDEQVRAVLGASGGIQPPPRSRRAEHLQTLEREEVSRLLAAGESCRGIARRLGRAPSTISREVARNGGRECYRALAAELRAEGQMRRPKVCKLQRTAALREYVEAKLRLYWSPQQVSRCLRTEHAGQAQMQISHEAIYRSLYVQSKATLKKELTAYLRQRKTLRQGKPAPTGRGQIKDMVLISQRPPEVADRAVPGHWEGDLLMGNPNDAVGTLVERRTRYLMLFKLPYRPTAEDVRRELARTIVRFPQELRRSLTWDRGKEMSSHARFTIDSGVQVYFCDPHSPWQRGTNENTNGLLRDYFPKGKSLRQVTQADLDEVARQLNERPRMTLDWQTPATVMAAFLDNVAGVGGAPTQ